MVEEYNRRAQAAGAAEIASAMQGNLLAQEPYFKDPKTGEKVLNFSQDPRFNDFDAVIVGLGFHHFDNYAGSMRKLAERVKDGGAVGIVDLVPSEKVWHS
jgi:SAM-dependent methyltransferase